MKRHTTEDAFYERMRNLADVNKKTVKESQNRSLGSLIDVTSITLSDLVSLNGVSKVDVIKADIEGAEFAALPAAIDDMPTVKDWIVELHPTRGRPETIIQAFIERGFEVHYVNRQTAQVEPYQPGTVWKSHATVIARRK
jgi:hypothetical protein